MEDVFAYNQASWTRQVSQKNKWTVPVDTQTIEDARRGQVDIVLTPQVIVPARWLGDVAGLDILCLASGGGQQGPILAAAGAHVTVLDACPAQLEQDRFVAEREGLSIELVCGDMRDLSMFEDASFDRIVHPVSNCFVQDIQPVWQESARVLREGGRLLSGFCKPLAFCYDWDVYEQQKQVWLRYGVPYSDLRSLEPERLQYLIDEGEPVVFGHSLSEQIGGQLKAGLVLVDMYEDFGGKPEDEAIDAIFPKFMATYATK